MTKITQTYYVSTGRKNAFYTLRCRRDCEGQSSVMFDLMPDFYVCTLSANEETASEKAKAYVAAMRERIGENENFKIVLDSIPDNENYKRRGKLSVRDSHSIDRIEAGYFPFGKHVGKAIADAPDSYVLFFADKLGNADNKPVMQVLAAACMGVALEKGLIAIREQRRAEQAEIDALSQHIGKVGERIEFSGVLFLSIERGGETTASYWINKVRCGNDIVTYIGANSLGKPGDEVSFRATIKKHDEYNGVKSTLVSRPY